MGLQFWDYSFGITVLELQFWDYSFGVTVLELQFWDYSMNILTIAYTSAILGAVLRHPLLNKFCEYSFGITVLGLQIWDYSFGITDLGLQYEHPDNCLHLSYSRRCITASLTH